MGLLTYGQLSKIFSVKLWLFSYPSVLICVLGAQKNRLIETVLFRTQNISFAWEIRKKKSVMQSYLGAWVYDRQTNLLFS